MAKISIPAGSSTDRAARWVLVAAGIAVVLFIPFSMSPYRVNQFTLVALFAVATMGINLLTGYNGQISLGHSFFFAVGAYTSAILIVDHDWPYLITLVPAFLLTFVLGFLFGIPALRLEGLYLALVTLALAVVAPPFIKRFDDLTGGSQGLIVPKPDAPEWTGLADDQWRYFVCVTVAALVFLATRNLVRGRVGRALIAVRDNHIAAETMGINLSIFKTLTFAISAAYAGLAGCLFAWVIGFVSPESFTVTLAIEFLSGAVVGGLATVLGPVFGAAFTVFVPVYAADFNPAAPNVLYGIALILVIMLMPSGVVGLLKRARDLVVDRSPRSGPGDPVEPAAIRSTPDQVPAPEPVPTVPNTGATRETST